MTLLNKLIDCLSPIIGYFIGLYIAEEAMRHFGYYNKTRVEKLMAEVMQDVYGGRCMCFN
jgi:hypothetical protein